MSATKGENSAPSVGWPLRFAQTLLRFALQRRQLLSLAIILAILGFGGRALWIHVREHVAARPEYRLDENEIAVTPPPPWIHADVRKMVIRNAGLDRGLSILDDGLVEHIHQAFSLHPWVGKVEQVSKRMPAHVEVTLVYRRPVLMVKVPDGFYAVDADAVVLPHEDFSRADVAAYPRLDGVESTPLGSEGTRWADPVVVAGAKVGQLLAPLWTDLDLKGLRWMKSSVGELGQTAQFELATAGGTTFIWGAAPGSEAPGELTGEQKIARLKNMLTQHGTLDGIDPDLRHPSPPPRTAARTGA